MHLKKMTGIIIIILLPSLIYLGTIYGSSVTDDIEMFSNEEKNDIILIVVETLRADHLQCYGYERNTAPNMCEFAEDAVLFEKAYSQGTSTTQSIPTLLTGKNPATVSLPDWNYAMSDDHISIAEVLSDNTYTSLSNEHRSNFDQGFKKQLSYNISKEFDTIFDVEVGNLFHWWFIIEQAHFPYDASDRYRKWDNLSLNQSELFFTGHGIMQPKLLDKIERVENISREQAIEELINLYDADIYKADDRVGNYIDELKNRGRYNDSLIIITSDHGEFLGEHGKFDHVGRPYREVIHVPLMIKFPENKWANERVNNRVRLSDLKPTILDYLGVNNIETSKLYGESVMPIILGEEDTDRDIVSVDHPDNVWAYIRNDDYKYFLENVEGHCLEGSDPRNEELFDLNTDPYENEDIKHENIEVLQNIRQKLCDIYLEGLSDRLELGEHDMDEETEQKLRDMGYLL